MNIYAVIKQVPDTETKIKLNADNSAIDETGIKWIPSIFDEVAICEAVTAKEKNPPSQLTVISAGPARVVEMLRWALALGADQAIHIDLPASADSAWTAQSIAACLKKEAGVDLIFTGKEALDDGASQVGTLVAEALGIPSINAVLGLEYTPGQLRCKREIEGGILEVIQTSLPALISAQRGLAATRFAPVTAILKAKKKEIKVYKPADLGTSEADQRIAYRNLQLPPPKASGVKLSGEAAAQVKELVSRLHNEAKVI